VKLCTVVPLAMYFISTNCALTFCAIFTLMRGFFSLARLVELRWNQMKLAPVGDRHPGQVSLAIPLWVAGGVVTNISDGYSHQKGRKGKFCISAGPVTMTVGILITIKLVINATSIYYCYLFRVHVNFSHRVNSETLISTCLAKKLCIISVSTKCSGSYDVSSVWLSGI